MSNHEQIAEEFKTLSEKIRRQLADEIMSGEYRIDQRLDESLLAARFGVSRTPIREAIRQLAATGLVKINPRRSAIVIPADPVAVGNAFEAAAEIEALTARWAASRASLVDTIELNNLNSDCRETANSVNLESFAAANRLFHDKIAELAENETLSQAGRLVRVQTAPFQRFQYQFEEERRVSCDEHQTIIEAIIRRNISEAQNAMREHILRTGTSVVRHIVGTKINSI